MRELKNDKIWFIMTTHNVHVDGKCRGNKKLILCLFKPYIIIEQVCSCSELATSEVAVELSGSNIQDASA